MSELDFMDYNFGDEVVKTDLTPPVDENENLDPDIGVHELTPPPDESDDIDPDMSLDIPTTFQEMYDFFLSGITDDMFMELTREDTEEMLQEILISALPHFEFPRWKNPFDIDLRRKQFSDTLTGEEMLILRYYMISEWISFQLASVELIRQKYSGLIFLAPFFSNKK